MLVVGTQGASRCPRGRNRRARRGDSHRRPQRGEFATLDQVTQRATRKAEGPATGTDVVIAALTGATGTAISSS